MTSRARARVPSARPTHRPAGVALTALAVLGLAGAVLTPLPKAAASVPLARSLRVGALDLHQCMLGGRSAFCGGMAVPLDYRHPTGVTITIHFGWLPATDPSRPRPATIVAQEGGPGYPSTGTASDYVAMLGPLLRTRNLLLMDERGTGHSAVIDCAPLQTLGNLTSTRAFRRDVAACARQLDHTYRSPGGGFVQASDLFDTANAARDLDRLLLALQTGPVDLYGDSYGTYFAQSFMSRFPQLLSSVTLDAAYEARDLDPWYVTTVTTARRAFDLVCQRSAACRAAAPGSSWARIATLARRLRTTPITGRAPGLDGALVRVRVDETALVNIVNDAGYDYAPYRELDAAVRAALGGDDLPILRLWAQDIGWDDSDYQAHASAYSDGQYMAVACTDYPQLFDMHAARAQRVDELRHAIASQPADTFAPFTIREWMGMQPYTETYTGCLDWPAPTHPADPPVAKGPMDPGHVPVLILNGSLDSLTPPPGGAHIARQIGPDARAVVVSNMVHLVGLDDRYGCGASLVQRFIARPGRLHTMDTSCRSTVPEVHAVGGYPTRLAAIAPAKGHAPLAERRAAAVALAAAGDAASRWDYVDGRADLGLRGGHVSYAPLGGGQIAASLAATRWTVDSSVSGRLTFSTDGLEGRGSLRVEAGGPTTRVTVSWRTTGPHAVATLRVDGHLLTLPAP